VFGSDIDILQSERVVDCPEFRNLLLYCGRELKEKDIPHRTRVSGLIIEAFKTSYNALIQEIEVGLVEGPRYETDLFLVFAWRGFIYK
jgi:hypothetical protein